MLVTRRPVHTSPRRHLDRTNEPQPSRLGERGLQILGSLLAQVTDGHAPGDFHPLSAQVRLLDHARLSLYQNAHVVDRGVVDAKEHAAVALDVARPGRSLAGNNIESAIA